LLCDLKGEGGFSLLVMTRFDHYIFNV
jgi:hypothetical protein